MLDETVDLERKLHRDENYYIEFVEFLVEDVLFQVPISLFASDDGSSKFWESIEPLVYYGNAIELKDVQAIDFRALLKHLHPLKSQSNAELTPDEWQSILRLTFKWKMHDVFEIAVDNLRFTLPSIDQLVLARVYGASSWLLDVYVKLLQRRPSFSDPEAESLGLDTVVKLINIRERYTYPAGTQHASIVESPFTGSIADELKQLSETEAPSIMDQLLLGRTYGVRMWVENSYKQLSQRKAPITLEEGKTLGLRTLTSICRARNGHKAHRSTWRSSDLYAEVRRMFQEELDQLDKIQERFGKPSSLGEGSTSEIGKRLPDGDPAQSEPAKKRLKAFM